MPDRRSKASTIFLWGTLLLAVYSEAGRLGAADWNQGSGYRYLELSPGAEEGPGFIRLSAAATGVTFTNLLSSDRSITNHVLLNGSGVAAGDIDDDGWVDLYFCGLDGSNRLYRNRGGWKFEDVTGSAGVECPDLDATGAAFVDLDGDSDMDLVVNTIGGGTHLFLNDGHGRFSPSPRSQF